MARRIIEEDVSTPTTTVHDDGSWVGRTIISLVLIAVLVLGAIWLFNNVGDGDGAGDGDGGGVNIEQNEGDTNVDAPDAPDVNAPEGDAPAPDQS